MIQSLSIKNLALIENAEVPFSKGLNIVTGETGSGKTIFLSALAFIFGKRVPNTLVRTGEDKAVVEATFELPSTSSIFSYLKEHEIQHDPDDLLFLKRELSKEGKSRTQINGKTVPLHILQKIASSLADFVDQSSHHELKKEETQRAELDLYADLEEEVLKFAKARAEEKSLQNALESLLLQNEKRKEEMETATFQLEELQRAKLHEEAACFQEYESLSKRKELLEKVYAMHTALSDAPQSIIAQLLRLKTPLENAAKIEPTLNEAISCFQEALIPLHEVGAILSKSLDLKEADPKRLQQLDERLSEMHQVKRKLGIQSSEEAKQRETALLEKLETLSSLEEKIEEVQEKLELAKEKTNALALGLTKRRKEAALRLEKELTEGLHSLNMQEAELSIVITQVARGSSGDDLAVFHLKANRGEAKIPIQNSASGGELSRLFLVLKTVLAEKNRTPLLVFDEIDANVGGKTATLIGEKLQFLAQKRQVVCVTHFPQVAQFGDQHLNIEKVGSGERTKATITLLSRDKREQEIQRMQGI